MLSSLSLGAWALLVVGAVAIGVSKTALPGVTTLAVAIFAAVLPARASTGTILLLLLVADAVAITTYWRDADWTTLRRLVPGVLAGVLLGAVFLGVAGDRVTKVFIGVLLLVLIAVTLLLMRRPRPPQVQGRVGRAVYGTLAGFTTMSANAGGPVMSMYLLASDFAVTSFLGTAPWPWASSGPRPCGSTSCWRRWCWPRPTVGACWRRGWTPSCSAGSSPS